MGGWSGTGTVVMVGGWGGTGTVVILGEGYSGDGG